METKVLAKTSTEKELLRLREGRKSVLEKDWWVGAQLWAAAWGQQPGKKIPEMEDCSWDSPLPGLPGQIERSHSFKAVEKGIANDMGGMPQCKIITNLAHWEFFKK